MRLKVLVLYDGHAPSHVIRCNDRAFNVRSCAKVILVEHAAASVIRKIRCERAVCEVQDALISVKNCAAVTAIKRISDIRVECSVRNTYGPPIAADAASKSGAISVKCAASDGDNTGIVPNPPSLVAALVVIEVLLETLMVPVVFQMPPPEQIRDEFDSARFNLKVLLTIFTVPLPALKIAPLPPLYKLLPTLDSLPLNVQLVMFTVPPLAF